ncbi:zinc finger protein weckle isoform X1 [Lucilia cuprina]|uniref:zinc finger protein weckle isoform X1 n=1 Tax=Lucilia cuprina TaxID=7375 RepID=UPI001F07040B|nr:zinc finger protein weckle isoform X1 [Lucilia cuprina]
MQSTFATPSIEDSLPNCWINWCRLCAKEDPNHNINFLYVNDHNVDMENKELSLQEALAKYFWVQTSLDDVLPKMLCTNCLSLVSSMINFNERVERVQLMYLHLAESQRQAKVLDLNAIRLKFDVTETERDNWFLRYFPIHKPEKTTIDKAQLTTEEENFKVQIKQENGEKFLAMDYDNYMEEDTDLEKEEIIFDEITPESLEEDDEEDPFQANDKETTFGQNDSSEEDEKEEPATELCSLRNQEQSPNSSLEKTKMKRKRKKLKQFSVGDYKKNKTNIKDFKMETKCKECGENFTKYMLYRDHMQQQHNHSRSNKHWPCPACDKVLLSLFNLERHVRIHVPLEVRKNIKCPECDNRYTSNAQLETHIRYKHKNEKPFICEECGLSLRTNSNLRQHMLIHTDVAPFECEVCKKKFKNKTRLKTHMDIHSPNKHVCNICGLQLNSKATLNRHFLVHSDEMQHKCDYCGKAFKRAKALKNHLLLHTGLKPYSCDFCDRTFANGSNCRSHMKKLHPEELAVLEASGNKTHTKNIPKLETLKAVTKAADNLTPVVTKFSGCFAFGKKPKNLAALDAKQTQKSSQKLKKPALKQLNNNNNGEQLAMASPSSTPLDLQCIPLAGNTTASSNCLPDAKNLENDFNTTSPSTTTTPIPNFDNIYQHLMKQNQIELQIKRSQTQHSPQPSLSNVSTSQHNTFYQQTSNDIINQSIKPTPANNDLLHSPNSHHSSMTSNLTHEDHSNASSIQANFYGSIRTALPPGNFM